MGRAGNTLPKKGTRGEAAAYLSRSQAVRRLQLSLRNFCRLCIYKGIYPREPKNRSKAQKGSTIIKQLYLKKDIKYLLHEPIIWKIREQKHHHKRFTRLKEVEGGATAWKYLYEKRPFYKLDNIVKERYPTFVDALDDLGDPLNICFLFAALKKYGKIPTDLLQLCRRLTIEFMHYVIETKALRKVFISIKGYYYQVEIMGQTITWMTPHNFTPEVTYGVDLMVMRSFAELYVTVLGFVNYRLYQNLNMYYPPKLDGGMSTTESNSTEEEGEDSPGIVYLNGRVEALNKPLMRSFVEDEEEEEDETLDEKLVDGTDLEPLRKQAEMIKRLKTLFKGMKFFIGRECNRESLTFVIRCCEGEVSWDDTLFCGATYKENDESITHQIVDRPGVERKYLSRYYIQPQWVYDCINARLLLPIQDYFTGAELPPHLSPFVEVSNHAYMPPEKHRLVEMMETGVPKSLIPDDASDDDDEEEEEIDGESDDEEEEEIDGESDDDDEEEGDDQEMDENDDDEEEDGEEEMKTEEVEDVAAKNRLKMNVKKGKPVKYDPTQEKILEDNYALKMRKFMIPKKHRRLYYKLNKKERHYNKRKVRYTKRRDAHDALKKEAKKNKKSE